MPHIPMFVHTFPTGVRESKAIGGLDGYGEDKCVLTPRANESRKILSVNAMSVGSVIPNLIATSVMPGAIIELASGETKV